MNNDKRGASKSSNLKKRSRSILRAVVDRLESRLLLSKVPLNTSASANVIWTAEEANLIQERAVGGTTTTTLYNAGTMPNLTNVTAIPGHGIYWVQNLDINENGYTGTSAIGSIMHMNDDGTNVSTVLSVTEPANTQANFDGIAVDENGGKIYWTDSEDYGHVTTVNRANLDGSNPQVLFTGKSGDVSTSVQVDPLHGKIYWSDWIAKVVYRANLDGSGLQQILTNTPVYGMAVDPIGGKLYLSEESSTAVYTIDTANLDGSNPQILITSGLNEPQGLAIDPAAGVGFVANTLGLNVSEFNLDGSGSPTTVATGLAYPLTTAFTAPFVSFPAQPSGAAAGSALAPITVDVDTADGAINTSDSSTVTLTLSNGTFSTGLPTASIAAVNGVATFSGLIINATGSYALTASDGSNQAAISSAFTVTPGPLNLAGVIVTDTPASLDVTQTSAVTVQAQDTFGNPDYGLTVGLQLFGSGTSSGTFGPVTDNGNGTYSSTFTATSAGTPHAIAATLNGQTAASQPTITVNAPPAVLSLNRQTPTGLTTNASSVVYGLTFSRAVTQVTPTCFQVITSGAVKASSLVTIAGSGSTYTVTVNGISGNGTVQLELVDNDTIVDGSGGSLGGLGVHNGSFIGQIYNIVQPGPTVSIVRASPASGVVPNGVTTVSYTVTFSEPVTGVSTADFTFPLTGSVTTLGAVTTAVSSSVYTVTINGVLGIGTVGLNLVDNGAIRDANGNSIQSTLTTSGFVNNRQNFAVGSFPASMAIGDLNNDGTPDIVVANSSSNTVSVLIGTGSGNYRNQVTYAVGGFPTSVTIADVNGDGYPDVIVTNSNDQNVGILLANPNGTLQPQYTYALAPYAQSVTVADINHDGKPDLIAVSDGVPCVLSVLLGNGDGTFQPQVTYTAGLYSPDTVVADVNNDGKPDVIAPSSSLNNVSVFEGNGDGTLQQPVTYAVGNDPKSITAADLNGDGNIDLVTSNLNDNTVSVLLGNGNGTFQPAVTYAVGANPKSVLAADFNGDGKLDLLVSNSNGSSFSLLQGNGDGTFQAQVTIGLPSQPYVAQSADLNADGRSDIVASGGTNETEIPNGSTGSVTGPTFTTGVTALAFTTKPTGGVAGAGIGPVVVQIDLGSGTVATGDTSPVTLTLSAGTFTSTGTNTVTVNAVNGVATFSGLIVDTAGTLTLTATDPTESLTPATTTFTVTPVVTLSRFTVGVSPAVIDVGGVGTITLSPATDIYGNPETGLGVVFYLNGSGTSGGTIGTVEPNANGTYSATFTATSSGTAHAIAATVNGGLVTSTQPTVTVTPLASVVSINRGSPAGPTTSASTVNYTVTFSQSVTGVIPADFTTVTTGTMTSTAIAVAPVSGSVYTVTVSGISGYGTIGLNFVDNGTVKDLSGFPLQSKTSSSFQTQQTYGSGTGQNGPGQVVLADLNHDGKLDIVADNQNANTVSVLLGNGDGTFQAQQTFAVGAASRVFVADVNGDNIPDIIVTSYTANSLVVLLGNGDGTFHPQTTISVTVPRSVAVADVNRDGIPDLVVLENTELSGINDTVQIFLGKGQGAFQAGFSYGVPENANTIGCADLNADGKIDIYAASPSTDRVYDFLGNGDGTFNPSTSYIDNNGQNSSTAADINGDGKLDIITYDSFGVGILTGNGNGTFSAGTTVPNSGTTTWTAVDDVNGDGKPDLISANGIGNDAIVQLGNGDGTFQAPATFAAGNYTAYVAVADVNGDGRPDLIVANSDGANISVMLGTGADNFTGQTYSTPPAKLFFAQQPAGGQAGTTLPAFSVDVEDAGGNIVTTDTSTVTVTLNGGTFSTGLATASVAAVNGVATFSTLIINATGNYNITASDSPLTSATSLNFSITNGAVSLSQSSLGISPSTLDIGMAATITLQAKDALGNNITSGGLGVSFSLGTTGTSGATIGQVVDHHNGTYTATLTATSAGTARTIAAAIGGSAVTSPLPTFTANALPYVVAINRTNPIGPTTGNSTVVYTATFSESVTGVTAASFAVPTTGGATYANLSVTPASGSIYTVTISGINGPGTLGLNLVDNGTIRDASGSPLQITSATAAMFQAQKTVASGSSPFTTLLADLNADGKADLIVPNNASSTVSTLLGNGDGTFQSIQTSTVVTLPESVTVGDVNGDGNQDLLVFGFSGGVSVLLGNGNGTFQTQKSFTAMPGEVMGALADVNGDGKLDLIAFSVSGTTIGVFPGNGDGTFGTATTYAVGSQPYSVTVADVNRDGKPDLVVANYGGHDISVLLGNGNGTFQAQKTYGTGLDPYSAAVTDLNGDGKLDVVTANNGDNTVSVLLGNGDGTFQAQKTYATGSGPQSVALADLNGDGKPDLLVANTGTLSVLLGNGDGTFQGQATFADSSSNAYTAVAADINGDTRPDLAVNNENSNNVGFLLNAGNDNFTGQVYTLQAAPPTITGFSVTPNPVTVGNTITLTATGVSDPNNGGTISNVTFYRESNGTSGLQTTAPADTIVGVVNTGSGGTYTLPNISVSTLAPGTYTYYAVATDNSSASSVASSYVETINPAVPTIAGFNATPNPATSGAMLTLSATGVADPNTGGTVTSVAFYRESNSVAGLQQTGTPADTLLGTAVTGTGGTWAISNVSTAGLVPGNYTYYAVATDNYSASSAVSSTANVLNPAAPTIGALSGMPPMVPVGGTFTLSATNITDPNAGGSITSVAFYRESNGIAGLQTLTNGDTLIGTVTTPSSGSWNLPNVSTTGLAPGTYTYYAVATDSYASSSAAASTTETVQALGITVGSVFVGSSSTGVVSGYFDLTFNVPAGISESLSGYQVEADLTPTNSSIALTGAAEAPNALFPGQTPIVAETGNVLQVTDVLSGSGQANPITNGAGLFRVLFSVAAGAPSGSFQVNLSQILLADAQGNPIPVGTITPGTITVVSPVPPTIGSLGASPSPVISGNNLTLTATGVTDPNAGGSISTVAFYRESNSTTGLQTGTGGDTLLGTATSGTGGAWTLANVSTAGLVPGAYTYYAIATDNYAAVSAVASTSNIINPAAPTIGTLAGTPNPVAAGSTFSLSAGTIIDPNTGGSITGVSFYRESNGTTGLQTGTSPDTFLGTVSSATAGVWTLPNVSTTGLAAGNYTYYAVATDNYAAVSAAASTSESIQAIGISIGSVTINSNSKNIVSGYFDLTFNVPAGLSPSLSGYQIQVNASPAGSGVTLTGAIAAPNPVFPGQTPTVLLSGNSLQVTDSLAGVGQSTIIADGEGLFRVQFSVAAGTPSGIYQLSLSQVLLSDAQGNSIAIGTVAPASITVVQLKVPEVTGVAFSGSNWNSAFPAYGGYAIPTGAAQTTDLPWIGLDTVAITFNEGVTITQNSLTIAGVNQSLYTASGFSYNTTTFVATWTFAAPFGPDRLLLNLASTGANAVVDSASNHLDGEWSTGSSVFPSGDGIAGGDFNFNVNVLPGDVDANGSVNIFDTIQTRNLQFNSVGSPNYAIRYDVDGSSSINIFDTIDVRNRQFTSLPSGSPSLPGNGAVSLKGPIKMLATQTGMAQSSVATTKSAIAAPTTLTKTITPTTAAKTQPVAVAAPADNPNASKKLSTAVPPATQTDRRSPK